MVETRDVYVLEVQGNFEEELQRVSRSIKTSRTAWADLRRSFQDSGAVFRRSQREMVRLRLSTNASAISANKKRVAIERLASKERQLALVSNGLVRAQDKLTRSRLTELTVLNQVQTQATPKILQARAEESALRRLTTELQRIAEKRIFAAEATRAGLAVSADGTRLFNAEATAARIAAQEVERLAIAEALRNRGLNTKGRALLQGPGQTAGLSFEEERLAHEKVLGEVQQKRVDSRLNQLRREAGLINETEKAHKQAGRAVEGVGKKAKAAEGPLNRISFTFRRLIGIMAAFTIARKVTQGFVAMIKESIRFNASLEANRVGLAGLIAAAGSVRDLQGNQLELSQQLEGAQNIAIDQNRKLRVEALRTAASFEEIARAFTQAVAPGLSAGLTLDQIRTVTVQISQAATGLGVAQNQLSEEIRSLFQGTITPRNTRIATALGISNADIRRAKETGQLFEFISKRFEAISRTGEKLMDTFTGQLSNAKDAFQQLLAASSEPLFEELKASLKEFQEAIFDIADDEAIFNPSAIKALGGLFDGLARGVSGIREAFKSIDATGFADSFGVVGESLGLTASLIAKVITSFFNIAAPAVTVVKLILATVTSLINAAKIYDTITLGVFSTFLKITGQLFVLKLVFVKLVKLTLVMKGAWKLIVAATRSQAALLRFSRIESGFLSKNFAKMLLAIRKMIIPLLLVGGALTLIAKVFPSLGEKVLDGISSVAKTLVGALDGLLDRIVGLPEEAKNAASNIVTDVVDDLRRLQEDLSELQVEYDKSVRDARSAARQRGAAIGIQPDVASQTTELLRQQAIATEKVLALDKQRTAQLAQQASFREQANTEDENARFFLRDFDKLNASVSKFKKLQEEKIKLTDLATGPLKRLNEEDAPRLDEIKRRLKEINAELDNGVSASAEWARNIIATEDPFGRALRSMEDRDVLLLREENARKNVFRLDELISESRSRQSNLAAIIVNSLAKESLFRERIATASAAITVGERKGELSTFLNRNKEQLEVVKAETLAKRQRLALDLKIGEFNRTELELRKQILRFLSLETNEGREAASATARQLFQKQALLKEDKEIARIEALITAEEIRRAKIRATGGLNAGFGLGLQEFAEENRSIAQVGENLAQSFANGIAGLAGQTFRSAMAAALDPNQNFDLAAAVSNLGIDLAASFITDLAKASIASLIGGAIKPVEDAGAAAANTVAASAYAASAKELVVAAGVIDVSAGGLAAAGATVSTEIGIATVAMVQAIAVAQGATVGIGTAFTAKGGRVHVDHIAPGFARGGSTRKQRPLGRDPRDTIPAMLRPGEWVIRPEAVRLYGNAFMSMLNRGKLNPGVLKGVANVGRASGPPVTIKRGFAEGGKVAASAGTGDEGGTQIVAQFFDEQVMDRAFAAGQTSMLRFTRRNRSAMRAALGVS